MPFEEEFKKEVEYVTLNMKHQTVSFKKLLKLIDCFGNLTPPCITVFGSFLKDVSFQYKILKNKCKGESSKHMLSLLDIHKEGVKILGVLCKQNDKKDLRGEALSCLLKLMTPYALYLMPKTSMFPVEYFADVLKNIIQAEGVITVQLDILKEILVNEDVATYIWKSLEVVVMDGTFSAGYIHNTLLIIGLLPKSDSTEPEEANFFCGFKDLKLNKKQIAVSVLKVWERLISFETTGSTKHLLVLTIIEKMMGRMEKPIILTDYFMTCLNCGGAVSLLGLQGIFELVQKHNINYPNIYNKLYSMYSPEMFSTPYKARLYYLSDVFLGSSHLPQAIVAGFIKRMARLSLVAPPPDIIILSKFITNLILRHPGLKKLLHNVENIDVTKDPYNYGESDPSKSGAMESSLWEMKLLQEHVLPSVSAAAMFVSTPLPGIENDLSVLLEVTTSDIFTREYRKKLKEPPMCYEKPSSLMLPNSQTGFTLWSFTD